ncbi:MAG: cyclase family protein [Candidatus Kapaibacterium sp.]
MSPREKQVVDLSHTIEGGMITYEGLPAPIICDYLSREESTKHYAEGVSFQIGKIEMVANTGTYVDVPFHRYAEGDDLAIITLEKLVNLEGILFQTEDRAITPELFTGTDLQGKAVLIQTGWDKHWREENYFSGNHPYLTAEAATFLRDAGATLVGIDSYNIDNTSDYARPAHSILLGAGIPIVEHMTNLSVLPQRGFTFTAAPPKIVGMGSFPVRAFATLS